MVFLERVGGRSKIAQRLGCQIVITSRRWAMVLSGIIHDVTSKAACIPDVLTKALLESNLVDAEAPRLSIVVVAMHNLIQKRHDLISAADSNSRRVTMGTTIHKLIRNKKSLPRKRKNLENAR